MRSFSKEIELRSFTLPKYQEIPAVGLYLEQVNQYLNECLAPLPNVELTSSMISNYVKKKLLARPQKKLYSREQIAYLLFIAISKTVLSLDDLKIAVKVQQESFTTERAYTYFCEEFGAALQAVFANQALTHENGSQPEQKIMLNNIISAVAHKIYLEQYFEKFH